MPSQKNIDQVSELKDKFTAAKSIIIADHSGLKVTDQTKLRAKAVEAGGEFRVSKNNLIRLALKEQGDLSDEIDKLLDGPNSLLLSNKDPVSALKALVEFSKENDLPKIKIGLMNGKVLSLEDIKSLASLPTKDELVAKLISQLKAPTSGFINVLSGNLRGLLQVLKAIGEKGSNRNKN